MKSFVPFLLLTLFFTSLNAQNSEKCGFNQFYEKMLESPIIQQKVEENEKQLRAFKNTPQERNLTTITIPCVVHILHNGQALGTSPNIVDAQINSAIADMTHAFKHTGYYATNSPTAPSGVTNIWNAVMNIEYVLAKTAPDGSATSGIINQLRF